jgi:hypothetical protein
VEIQARAGREHRRVFALRVCKQGIRRNAMDKVKIRVGTSVLALMAVMALAACGPPPQPVYATIPVPTLQVHDQPEVTKDGLTISLHPIMEDTVRSLPQVYKMVAFTVMRHPSSIFGGPDTSKPAQPVQTKSELSIIPLPAFKVSVANHTGHVLKFTQAVFRLETGTGQSYELFSGSNEIGAWLENVFNSQPDLGPQVATQVMPGLKDALNALPMLNRNRELLNGDEWSGFLVFNLNLSSANDAKKFVNSIDRLTIRLAEVPVALTDAGQVSKTTEFTFVVDKTTSPLHVKCPPGTKSPSTEICVEDEEM